MAQFEYLFDGGDADVTGGLAEGWTGKNTLNDHAKAVQAVAWMQANYPREAWIVFAHVERKQPRAGYVGSGSSGYTISDFRDLNGAGPDVCFGFESMPGHQKEPGRGGYSTSAVGGGTYGGCGMYAAKVGGLWDALLGEGRRWWLFASSDFHDTEDDFWPGEYQKTWTYVQDPTDPQAIVGGLRSGNSFVVEGDLIIDRSFSARALGRRRRPRARDVMAPCPFRAARPCRILDGTRLGDATEPGTEGLRRGGAAGERRAPMHHAPRRPPEGPNRRLHGRSARFLVRGALALAGAAALGAGVQAAESPPCGIPPPAAPKRIKGGEGIPPLPLPATPLRRTERKRDPAPPLLVGKLRWGRRDLVWRLPDGREIRYGDWNHDPNDMPRLLEALGREIGTKYRSTEMELAGFSFDPEETSILYATGLEAVDFGEREREMLREYLLRGGFFLAVAHHGSSGFSDSIRDLARSLFPGRPFGLLPPDHPIHRSHRRLDRVAYSPGTKDRPEGAPFLEGLSIGCRAAIVLSPYDLCCTWDSDHLPAEEPGILGPDAFGIGVNILSYAVAHYPLGKFYGRWGLVEMEDPEVDRGDFVFGQVRHSGDHDPHPVAFANLLAEVMKSTTIGARFRRRMVPLSSPETGRLPFLYLTGHGDFRLSEEERAGLRRFLSSGGFLFGDACCGDLTFDVAFRREVAAALPESRLEPLPADHPIFSAFETVREVEYTTAVRASFPDLRGPFLEGIEIDGSLRVVWSRFDVGNGWEGEDRPFALGLRPADARRLGVNIVVHAMTH